MDGLVELIMVPSLWTMGQIRSQLGYDMFHKGIEIIMPNSVVGRYEPNVPIKL